MAREAGTRYCRHTATTDEFSHLPAPIDPLTLFGLAAVILMLACYALEDRSPWYVLAFAVGCLLASVYGFLQGAWPFGLIEAIWALIALRRWRRRAASQG